METKDFRSLGPEAQENLRRLAVAAVNGGETRVEAARRFGVTRQSVGKWVQEYERGGDAALRARRRGRPPGGSLAPWQAAQTAKAVVDHCPEVDLGTQYAIGSPPRLGPGLCGRSVRWTRL